MLAQRRQRLPDQQAALDRPHADQPHVAVGEVDDLQRAGVLDQLLDVVGDQLLGADPGVDREADVLREQVRAGGIGRAADAGDLGRSLEQGPGHVARDHVDLVAVGQRDQQVGVGAAGRLEHRGARGVAADGADVQPVLQLAQHGVVRVDDRDLVGLFAGQVVGGGAAHLPGAKDDDFHVTTRD